MNTLTDDDLKEFASLWNKLSEKNKEHIRKGLKPTDGMIQTAEQAKLVIACMKGLLAFQMLEGENEDGDGKSSQNNE